MPRMLVRKGVRAGGGGGGGEEDCNNDASWGPCSHVWSLESVGRYPREIIIARASLRDIVKRSICVNAQTE